MKRYSNEMSKLYKTVMLQSDENSSKESHYMKKKHSIKSGLGDRLRVDWLCFELE